MMHENLRNTPTHVGKTISQQSIPAKSQKHPHARGEDLDEVLAGPGKEETPPRTWGRLRAYGHLSLGD